MRKLVVYAVPVAAVYVILLGGLFAAMLQPPAKFGRIMSKLPAVTYFLFPFKPMWLIARGGNLKVGDMAPDFKLPCTTGDKSGDFQLSAHRGKNVVLAFYPMDFTPVCSLEMPAFEKSLEKFTSANAVDAFLDRLLAGPQDLRALKGVKLCAVGPRTAERLARAGLKVDLMPAEYRADAVLRAMTEAGEIAGRAALLPHADIGREIIADELRRQGAEVTSVVAYRTVAEDPEREGEPDVYRMLLERSIDVVHSGRVTAGWDAADPAHAVLELVVDFVARHDGHVQVEDGEVGLVGRLFVGQLVAIDISPSQSARPCADHIERIGRDHQTFADLQPKFLCGAAIDGGVRLERSDQVDRDDGVKAPADLVRRQVVKKIRFPVGEHHELEAST